jgi:hypothetical protein
VGCANHVQQACGWYLQSERQQWFVNGKVKPAHATGYDEVSSGEEVTNLHRQQCHAVQRVAGLLFDCGQH